MSAPFAYRSSCVPLALSALTGLNAGDVADRLWRAGCARAVGAGGLQIGTDTELAVDRVIVRDGHRVQRFNPTGELLFSAVEFEIWLAESAAFAFWRVERPRRGPAVPGAYVLDIEGSRPPARTADLLSVREWRSRFPCGRWLLVVWLDGGNTHALALVDGEIVAGGEHYKDAVIVAAYRFLTRRAP